MADTNWTFSQEFYSKFQISRSDLTAQIESAKSTPPIAANARQAFSVDLAKLTKSLVDATGSLPAYDQRKCELQLKALEKMLDDLRSSAVPKSKFAFKRRTPKPLVSISTIPTTEDSVISSDTNLLPPTTTSSTNLTLSSHAHRYLTLNSLPSSLFSSQNSDLTISDLDGCIVNLICLDSSPNDPHTGSSNTTNRTIDISSLHIRNITNTVLLLPIIKNSVLLHDVSASVIVVGCHQFRMHNSQDVDVYLAIPSNPIIEHSSNIQFGAYPEALLTQAEPIKTSNHHSVQDFSHIRPTASPNWSILVDAKQDNPWPTLSIKDRKELDTTLGTLLPSSHAS